MTNYYERFPLKEVKLSGGGGGGGEMAWCLKCFLSKSEDQCPSNHRKVVSNLSAL